MAHRSNLRSSLLVAALALAITASSASAQSSKRNAQSLVTQGIHLIERKQYDDALEKFRAAYDAYPSPKILLNIGSTLRDMGRRADAANTYARYLDDPGADPARTVEVTKLLRDLDRKVTVLVVDVTPLGGDLAIDDGPWIPASGRMQTRVDAGTHLVRARKPGLAPQELTVDGHPGSHEDVAITLRAVESAPPPPPPLVTSAPPIVRANRVPPKPRVVLVEPLPPSEDDAVVVVAPRPRSPAPAGLQVESRVDGRLRGAAAAVGFVVDSSALEIEVSAIVSHDAERVVPGAYLGLRLHAGDDVRPFLGVGAPMIWSGGEARLAIRGSGGLEVFMTPNFGVLVDLGVEHFFNPQSTYQATLFVPIVGLQGRL